MFIFGHKFGLYVIKAPDGLIRDFNNAWLNIVKEDADSGR